jgi:hypothetical protein
VKRSLQEKTIGLPVAIVFARVKRRDFCPSLATFGGGHIRLNTEPAAARFYQNRQYRNVRITITSAAAMLKPAVVE